MLDQLLTQGQADRPAETNLLITDIRTDGGTQPRAGIDQTVVDEYAEVYAADPLRMPPVAVTYDGSAYWLTDGFHRIAAARSVDLARVRVVVTPGTQADAQWTSYAANATHGLRRTTADKQRAIRAALRHPNAAALSNSAIAAHLGVTDKTVAKVRDAMETTSEIPKSTQRTGADGRTINTANIGPRPGTPSPSAAPAPGPFIGGILATPSEVADAIARHIIYRGDGAYQMMYNFLLRAKQPGAARMEIVRTLGQNRYTYVDDYPGDLLLDGIRTLLQRTMQAEQDRITAMEEAGHPNPDADDDPDPAIDDDEPGNPEPQLGPRPTSEIPKSNGAGLPPLDLPGSPWSNGPAPKRVGPPAQNASDRKKLAFETRVAFQKALNCVRFYEELTYRELGSQYDHLFKMLSAGMSYMIDIENNTGPYADPTPPATPATDWRATWGNVIDQPHYDQLMARSTWTVDDVLTTNVALRLMDELPEMRAALQQRHDDLMARGPKPA